MRFAIMPEKFEPYSYEKAREESDKMETKVKSGEASNHEEAGRLLERERELQKIRNVIEQATDGNGMPIDEGIKEAVIMLNALGLNTDQSCE